MIIARVNWNPTEKKLFLDHLSSLIHPSIHPSILHGVLVLSDEYRKLVKYHLKEWCLSARRHTGHAGHIHTHTHTHIL
jgi:hypothetical protein